MKKKLSINWLIFAGIIGSILFIVPYAYGIYIAVTDEPAKVSNLSIGWSQSQQQTEGVVIPIGIPSLKVCGFLEAKRDKFLYVDVFNIEDNSFIGGSADEFLKPGEFCLVVKIRYSLSSGKYVAKVFYQRQEIAKINFEVK
jgi:hypothetical protein